MNTNNFIENLGIITLILSPSADDVSEYLYGVAQKMIKDCQPLLLVDVETECFSSLVDYAEQKGCGIAYHQCLLNGTWEQWIKNKYNSGIILLDCVGRYTEDTQIEKRDVLRQILILIGTLKKYPYRKNIIGLPLDDKEKTMFDKLRVSADTVVDLGRQQDFMEGESSIIVPKNISNVRQGADNNFPAIKKHDKIKQSETKKYIESYFNQLHYSEEQMKNIIYREAGVFNIEKIDSIKDLEHLKRKLESIVNENDAITVKSGVDYISRERLNNLKARVHIHKKEIGLSDKDYRNILLLQTGKNSCSKMTENELDKVLKALEFLLKEHSVNGNI